MALRPPACLSLSLSGCLPQPPSRRHRVRDLRARPLARGAEAGGPGPGSRAGVAGSGTGILGAGVPGAGAHLGSARASALEPLGASAAGGRGERGEERTGAGPALRRHCGRGARGAQHRPAGSLLVDGGRSRVRGRAGGLGVRMRVAGCREAFGGPSGRGRPQRGLSSRGSSGP